jgi:hypothetical protein
MGAFHLLRNLKCKVFKSATIVLDPTVQKNEGHYETLENYFASFSARVVRKNPGITDNRKLLDHKFF